MRKGRDKWEAQPPVGTFPHLMAACGVLWDGTGRGGELEGSGLEEGPRGPPVGVGGTL